MITPLFIGYSCPLFIVHCTLIFFRYIPTRIIEAALYSCSTLHIMYQYCLFVCCNFCGWLLYVSSPHNTNAIIFITWWSTTAFLHSMFVVFKQYDNIGTSSPPSLISNWGAKHYSLRVRDDRSFVAKTYHRCHHRRNHSYHNSTW